ncbi:helix-turn-helix domain-containing protein [Streptomyces sp. NPDC012756]
MFLGESGAWRTTAAALHIHVSTLHYRIEHLTGRDRVDLYLACAVD